MKKAILHEIKLIKKAGYLLKYVLIMNDLKKIKRDIPPPKVMFLQSYHEILCWSIPTRKSKKFLNSNVYKQARIKL